MEKVAGRPTFLNGPIGLSGPESYQNVRETGARLGGPNIKLIGDSQKSGLSGMWSRDLIPVYFLYKNHFHYKGDGEFLAPQMNGNILFMILRSEVDFSIDDFNKIGGKVPLIANLKPHGKVRKLMLFSLLMYSNLKYALSYNFELRPSVALVSNGRFGQNWRSPGECILCFVLLVSFFFFLYLLCVRSAITRPFYVSVHLLKGRKCYYNLKTLSSRRCHGV